MEIGDLLFGRFRRRLWAEDGKARSYLFLLSPPLSGSTLIKELIEGSASVSSFACEGQWLKGLEDVLGVESRWDPDLEIDWDKVRRVFGRNWDPRRPVLFEKSPPHLLRADQLAKVFSPSSFIIVIRNPYAQIEGLLRRGWEESPADAAKFWLKCAAFQQHNIEQFPDSLFFTYEELAEDTAGVLSRLQAYVPELTDLEHDRVFHAHNVTGAPMRGVKNLNDEKISRLSPDEIEEITRVLSGSRDLISRFGYQLLD